MKGKVFFNRYPYDYSFSFVHELEEFLQKVDKETNLNIRRR